MTGIEWDARFSTGIDEIDRDHQQLVELINNLHQAMMQRQCRNALPTIMDDLARYVSDHFQREETLMDLHNYPASVQHRLSHGHFAGMVNDFQKRLEQGEFAISTSVFVMLQNWLIEHIMGADREFTRHILAGGQAGA